ncbi:HNH endonuclease signature motif containing protein [Candidatus Nitrosacidococcus sp. I8]|uniref:HNH endonuclease signature motif containing protein n=1 Tax=Candidatus Nitrosacidococcus sp. I8 TaxID=2942908 RepID=UPI002227A2BA|nr:HNH endonuclease signature motif containing protein [Candidatus Nitrosacidococcus sp. I8]CAH9018752.1 hypothetical protein NURINAE_01112 [Candidatus Nitrosacidococcus sp. I8]
MKLPDFYQFAPLNRLKEKMGIKQDHYGDFSMTVELSNRLTEAELKQLNSVEGIDISSNDIIEHPDDGTLVYKGNRVLLYIRDVASYSGREQAPKFHLAYCGTLRDMQSTGRFDRYVVSTHTDGQFKINIIIGNKPFPEIRPLNVCKNCLSKLNFDGYKSLKMGEQRSQFVADFKITDFFAKYPQSLHAQTPKYNADNAPLNVYPDDFSEISRKAKEIANWCCDQCGKNCSKEKTGLHTHHINGSKHDNRLINLKVLCEFCHTQQPHHQHMKGLRQRC